MHNQTTLISIDNQLKAKYPDAPFEVIKEKLLTDDSAIIITLNQYRALLDYRLKCYRPKTQKPQFRAKPIRTEILPDWFDSPEPSISIKSDADLEIARQGIREKMQKLRTK